MKFKYRYPITESTVNIKSANLSNRLNSLEQVLDNMLLSHGTGLLLAGSTGIGKTTFIKQVGKMLGMPVILIEAPHITEEHLINIPFITFQPTGGKKDGNVVLDMTKFDVTLAQSHLAAELHSAQPISDAAFAANMKSADDNTKELYKQLANGVEDRIPDDIKQVRSRYKAILFLDEYFRQTSTNVRNILRSILNGRIGNDRIPPGIFVIYASNLHDTGSTIEQLPSNADFKVMDFKAPTKDEFFHYFISKFQANTDVKLNPAVINAFYSALKDPHISHDDLDANIRTSPRRWEQLLLYINSSLPVKNKEDASALLANVKANFSDELGETSSLFQFVDDIVRKLIGATGGEQFKDEKANAASNWRSTLEHQIETKIKLGDSRSYIPVVMGLPGIGKTAQMRDVSHRLNLQLVSIDCSTLSSDDITGIPIPNKTGDKLSVGFAEPALYKRIKSDMAEADAEFMSDPDVPKAKKAKYNEQKFKYILFFDELNRVGNANVFNSLRRVILEKSFNDHIKLPSNCVIVAAMNPNDKGTQELTGHLKDAVDLIDAHLSWSAFSSWLEKAKKEAPEIKNYGDSAKDVAEKILDGFVNTFSIKRPIGNIDADALKFNVKLQGDENMYISPREYWTLYADLVAGISRVLGKFGPDETKNQDLLYKAIVQKLESTLKWVMRKHEIDSPQFLMAVASWLKQEMAKFMIKNRKGASLESMLDDTLSNSNHHLKDDQDFLNYVQNFDLNKFSEDIDAYFKKLLDQEKKKYELLSKNAHNAKQLQAGKVTIQEELISKIEYVIKEVKIAAKANNLAGDIIDGMEHRIIAVLPDLVEGQISDELWDKLLQKVITIFEPEA